MDSSLEDLALDPSKCSQMSVDEKRELIYELSRRSLGVSEVLQSWSRQDILKILCAVMGKERKYTGLNKMKLIENLLKLVSENISGEYEVLSGHEPDSSPAGGQKASKRQRKSDNLSRLPVPVNDTTVHNGGSDRSDTTYCKNSACKATMRPGDTFCKRCSCCICYLYDDNKDPSLWLICSSEPPLQGSSCGMSCHLDCALKHENCRIGKHRRNGGTDGSFYCAACGKMNDLLGCWRKQLVVAKETRRADILCYRMSLGQKLLNGTAKFQRLYEIVDEAVKLLEAEVGPLTGAPVKMGRGIVNRLSSGPEVQRHCSLAVEALDKMLSDPAVCSSSISIIQDSNSNASSMVRFEDVRSTSVTVIFGSKEPSEAGILGYTLWHRKAQDREYPVKSTCTLFAPNTRFVVTGLTPATGYCFKIVCFNGTTELGKCEAQIASACSGDEVQDCLEIVRSQSPATNCSSFSNPSSVEDETNNISSDQNDGRSDNSISCCKGADKSVSMNLCNGGTDCIILCEDGNLPDAVSLPREEHVTGLADKGSDAEKLEKRHVPEDHMTDEISTDNGSDAPVQTSFGCLVPIDSSEAGLPITPCRLEISKDGQERNGRPNPSSKVAEDGSDRGKEPQDGSSSKKRNGERRDEECMGNGLSDEDFERYVKVIRWLECEGHIEKIFRQKFLTWFSLRATPQEVRVVKVFVDTFMEDAASLAEQLVDTFSDCISSKRSSVVPAGFCPKLWH